MKIVSACLAGIECRYDKTSKPNKKIIELVKKGLAIPVCPEELAGLTTPRIASEKKGNKIITKNGKDITKEFENGAKKALEIAIKNNCNKAILKSKSQSCGCNEIYDGTFTGKTIKADGIFCELLKKNKIKIQNEKEYQ